MAIESSEWNGLVTGRKDPEGVPVIAMPISASAHGGSGTFLAADERGRQWWVKPLNNQQGPRVTVTETLVGSAGRLVGAPVCDTAVVYLPPELSGWEFRPGSAIKAGFAHASRAVEGAYEAYEILYGDRDDNHRRHAGVLALYDWCWGGDDQWLYSEVQDRRLYSHDHGWYLPETGSQWNESTLVARVDEPHPLRSAPDEVSEDELARLAERLRTITREELVGVVRAVPASWPVGNHELEAVGWFLERRARPVAERLEELKGGTS